MTAPPSQVPSDACLETLPAKDDRIFLAALHDGKVVGGLAACVLEKYLVAEQQKTGTSV